MTVEVKDTAEQKEKLSPQFMHGRFTNKNKNLAGGKIKLILTNARGNNIFNRWVKITKENGWFVARPFGTEDIYKIYAESFLSKDHLKKTIDEAQTIVNAAL